MDKYENAVTDILNQYRSKTSRQKYGSSEVYTQFKQGIFVRLSQHSSANLELTSTNRRSKILVYRYRPLANSFQEVCIDEL